MNFPTSVLCNEAGQEVLKQQVRRAVNSLNREWNFCSNSFEGINYFRKVIYLTKNKQIFNLYKNNYFIGTRECKNLAINVQCDHRARVTRQAKEDDAGTYAVSVDILTEP